MRASKSKGFSLIELVVVVMIVGILTAIAIPSYSTYVVKSNRRAAQQVLLDIAQRQQEYFVNAREYADALIKLNYQVDSNVAEKYDVSIEVSEDLPPSFTLTATPKAGSSQSQDPVLQLDNFGVKLPEDKW